MTWQIFVLILTLSSPAFGASYFNKIVGGQTADIKEIPYQAAILVDYNRNGQFSLRCGGSIISDKVILTAAYCPGEYGDVKEIWKVRVGSSKYNEGGQLVNVGKIISHKKYDVLFGDYDIALFFLEKSVSFGNSVSPISMVNKDSLVPDGTSVLVSGWGSTVARGSPSPNLRKVILQTENHDSCAKKYDDMEWPITDRMICAVSKTEGQDACLGDEGGPMVANGKLIGITSGGYGCADEEYPSLWTSVSNLRSWIDDQLLAE